MNKKIGFLGFGVFFGFALSRVGASDFDLIVGMFTGKDLKLAWVMITSIVIGALGMQFLKKMKKPMSTMATKAIVPSRTAPMFRNIWMNASTAA